MEVLLRVIASDAESLREIPLDRSRITVGRDRRNAVCIKKDFISARHAIITREENALFLQDCESRNGTFINGEKLGGERVGFVVGDIVRFGSVKFEVVSREAESDETGRKVSQPEISGQGEGSGPATPTAPAAGIPVIPLKDRKRSGPTITSP